MLLHFFFSCYGAHRDLHSFPTRRSSDLDGELLDRLRQRLYLHVESGEIVLGVVRGPPLTCVPVDDELPGGTPWNGPQRSEEHTSELQSHHDLVCRLLLEKKKNTEIEVYR